MTDKQTLAAALVEINDLLASDPDSKLFGVKRSTLAPIAALTRVMSDDLAERAGKVLGELAPYRKEDRGSNHPQSVACRNAADLITTLIAQNAALRAERDRYRDAFNTNCLVLRGTEDRAERLEAVMRKIADTDPDEGTGWFHDVARAALKGADHD